MKKTALYASVFCFVFFSAVSMALQNYGSFDPATKGFYLCIVQGLVFSAIMYFVFRYAFVKK